ncbi:hypothetical protein WMF20_09295 [Sorangium sp. So ce834]|uniref:hypothetical protein n=1 Tax=Sorangium sp. So ce834 TaxID=3133321 RepID=UPI003F628F5B
MAQLARRWSALERAWGVRHKTRFAPDGDVQLAAQPAANGCATSEGGAQAGAGAVQQRTTNEHRHC